jgi:hypothetical protein
MRRSLLTLLFLFVPFHTFATNLWESNPVGAPENNNIYNVSQADLRNGNITLDRIPMMIASAIEYLLLIAGSVAVVSLIYHAARMQIASGITGDSSWVDRAKKWIYWSIAGFVLAMSAWFLVTKVVEFMAGIT